MKDTNLPRHHVDTSVLVEPPNTEDGRFCTRYRQKLNYNYKGVLSFPVLSELFIIINSLENFNDRYDFLEPLLTLIKTKNVGFYAPKNIGNLLNEIKTADNRIAHTDREIMACASEDKSYALITLDEDMLNNKKLELLLKIKILHLKELL